MREGERMRQRICTWLHTDSRETHSGLRFMNQEIMAQGELRHFTDGATQVPWTVVIFGEKYGLGRDRPEILEC